MYHHLEHLLKYTLLALCPEFLILCLTSWCCWSTRPYHKNHWNGKIERKAHTPYPDPHLQSFRWGRGSNCNFGWRWKHQDMRVYTFDYWMKTAYITYRHDRSLRENRKGIELATFLSSSKQANATGKIWWGSKINKDSFLLYPMIV